MKNVTKKLGVAAITAPMVVALPAMAEGLSFDTTTVVAAGATILAAVGTIGAAFMLIPAAIKGWGVVKAIIFRS